MFKDGEVISAQLKIATVVGVLLFSCICAFRNIAATPLDDHEAYVSVTSREMIQNHEYAIPTMNGEFRIKKPPLQYWLVVGASKITGTIDEFTTRLPSAIAGILTTAAILYFASRWLGFRTAVLSAMMWSTSMGFLRYSQNGRAEITLTFFVALTMMAFYELTRSQSRRMQVIMALVFWVSFAFANLAKGPIPFLFVVAPILIWAQIYKQWKMLGKMLPIAGIIIFLAITLPWPITIIKTLPDWAMIWKQQSIDRYVSGAGKSGPVYYLPYIFVLTAPWAGFVAASLIAPFLKQWSQKKNMILFLWLWFVLGVVLMSLGSGKRSHYILPSMPAMMILCGIIFDEIVFTRANTEASFTRNFFLVHLFVCLGLIIAGPLMVRHYASGAFKPVLLACAVGIAALAVMTIFYACNQRKLFSASVFIGFVITIFVFMSAMVTTKKDEFFALKNLALNVKEMIPQNKQLTSFKFIPSSFVHYFGREAPCSRDPNQMARWYDEGKYILIESKYKIDTTRFEKFASFDDYRKDGKEPVSAEIFHKPEK